MSDRKFELQVDEMHKSFSLAERLSKFKIHSKAGVEGIFIMLMKAKSIGMSPSDAISGGMFFINGKVELTAYSMNALIRRAGHKIEKHKESDSKRCILTGTRCDTGEKLTVEFNLNDAYQADLVDLDKDGNIKQSQYKNDVNIKQGQYKNPWSKYTSDMLFARALSRLARQLFADVTCGCYVEGEIQNNKNKKDINQEYITEDQSNELKQLIDKCDDSVYQTVIDRVRYFNPSAETIDDIPLAIYERVKSFVLNSKNVIEQKEECA